MRIPRLFPLVAILALVSPSAARADVVLFNNFDSQDGFDLVNSAGVLGSNKSFGLGDVATGFQFTPSATAPLSQLDIAIHLNDGGANEIIIRLQEDDNGAPGNVLEEF